MRYGINVDAMMSSDEYITVYCASLQDLPNMSLSRDRVAECSRCSLLLRVSTMFVHEHLKGALLDSSGPE
jgi:hypothetical protein